MSLSADVRHAPFLTARVAAICYVAVAAVGLSPKVFVSLTAAMAFTHYVLALGYSRHRLGALVRDLRYWPLLSALLLLFLAVQVRGLLSWASYGILHYLAGDIAVATRAFGWGEGGWRFGFLGRVVANGLASAIVFRADLGLSFLTTNGVALLVGGYALSGVLFCRGLRRLCEARQDKQWIKQIAFEAIVALVVVLSFFAPVSFFQASLAHFVFWTVLPAARMGRGGGLGPFLAFTVLMAVGFFLITPAGIGFLQVPEKSLFAAWSLASNLHITLSLALSPELRKASEILVSRLPFASARYS